MTLFLCEKSIFLLPYPYSMKLLLLCVFFLFSTWLSAQNVGLGTTTPEARLHIRSTGWIKAILENDEGQPRGYIGADNNGTVTFAANAYWNGSTWVYPNAGASFYMLLHRVNNQFEFRVRPDGGNQSTAMVINQNGNVGIGTGSPQQMLSVQNGIAIDQGNNNTGTIENGLRFGSLSGEGIGSKRNAGSGQYGLDFYTNSVQRMTIGQNGNIGINNRLPKSRVTIYHPGELDIPLDIDDGHAITIFDSSYFSLGEPRLSLNFGINSLREYAYIRVRKNATLGPVPRLLLNPLAEAAVVVGAGGDGTGYAQEATTYKFIVGANAPALFDNKVDIFGNLTVQNGKGIIRNTTGTQLKHVVSSVTVNPGTIAGNSTYSQNVSWTESFSAPPVAAYIANFTSGGGWAELVLSIANVTSAGCTLYIFNPRLSANTPNFIFNVVAVGPQ